MRYFTPELLARFRSPDDAVAEAASAEWDAATAAHDEMLRRLRAGMPFQARKTIHKHGFHDSRLIAFAIMEGSHVFGVSMYVQMEGRDGKEGETLEFKYIGPNAKGREPLLFDRAAADPGRVSGRARILYDEFGKEGDRLFSHSLLLADGSEARILFADMKARRVEYMEPGVAGVVVSGRVPAGVPPIMAAG